MPVHEHTLDLLPLPGMHRSSPLTRLNYFDGLFLRAEHLRLDQNGHRSLVFQSNIGGGSGVVHGMNALLDGADISVSAGLAIDPRGRVLLLVDGVSASITELLQRRSADDRGRVSRSRVRLPGFQPCDLIEDATPSEVTDAVELYLVTVAHAESVCGWEEVRGRACEDACDTTAERPYLMEHALIRLRPLVLKTPLITSTAVSLAARHLQSRVASAYFADERELGGCIVSGAGLSSSTWCAGAVAPAGDDVPLGVLALAGTTPLFLDPWIARRELIETPPRRYWAGRMCMRPWDVFLAQVLQFQCQLTDVIEGKGGSIVLTEDPCKDSTKLLADAVSLLDVLGTKIQKASLSGLQPVRRAAAMVAGEVHPTDRDDTGGTGGAGGEEVHELARLEVPDVISALDAVGGFDRIASIRRRFGDIVGAPGSQVRRVLINGGIVELPPAGYLPVSPTSSTPLERQVADLMGPGVDLRFCAVRTDQIPGELEHGQHLDRINLVQGIDDPSRLELVDIFVPGGKVTGAKAAFGKSLAFDGSLSSKMISGFVSYARAAADDAQLPLLGAARADALPGGAVSLHIAATGGASSQRAAASVIRWPADVATGTRIRRIDFGSTTPSILRSRNVAAVATARSAMLRAGSSTRTPTVAPVEDDGEPVALWLTVECGANPFAMSAGQATTFRAELRFLSPVGRARSMQMEALGTLTAQPVRAGEVVVRVTGQGSTVMDGQPLVDNLFDEQLRLTVDGNSLTMGSATASADSPVLRLDWTPGAKLTANATFDSKQSGFFAGGFAVESDTVDDPGDDHHEAAQLAVTMLEGSAGGEHFAERALSLLFPAGTRGPAGGGVEATTDWVLFRRRTRDDCATPEAPAPAPVVDERRVVGWHRLAKSQDEAVSLMRAVRGGSAEKFDWERLDAARFAGRTDTLLTPPSVLQSRWTSLSGGAITWFAGYATPTGAIAAEGRDRLRSVLRALAPVTTLRDAPDAADNIGAVPGTFLEPGADAAAFFISVGKPPEADLCAHIEVLQVDDNDLWELVIKPDRAAVADARREGKFKDTGMATRFNWGIQLDGVTPDRSAWWWQPKFAIWVANDFDGDERERVAVGFANDIVGQLGWQLAEPVVRTVPSTDGDCPIRLFVLPASPFIVVTPPPPPPGRIVVPTRPLRPDQPDPIG